MTQKQRPTVVWVPSKASQRAASRKRALIVLVSVASAVLFVSLLCCGLLGLAVLTTKPERKGGAHVKAQPPANPKQEDYHYPKTGEIVVLNNSGEYLFVPTTLSSRDEFQKLLEAKDRLGIEQMVRGGEVLFCPPDTVAKVLEVGFVSHRVRIWQGKYAGNEGWVEKQFCFKYRSKK